MSCSSEPMSPVRRGSRVMPQSLLVPGNSRESWPAITETSAWALSSVTSRFNRPTTSRNRKPRWLKPAGSGGRSDQTLAGRENFTRSETTPTTVWGRPFNRISRPMSVGSLAKARAPEPFAQHDGGGRRPFVRRKKCPARHRGDAEHVEERRRDELAIDALDPAVGSLEQRTAAKIRRDRRGRLERSVPLLHITQVDRAHRRASGRRTPLPDHHQPIGLGVGQRAQHRRVGEREHRAVGADPERQRQYRDQREARRAFHLADGEPHVAAEVLEPLRDAHLAIPLSADVDARAFQPRHVTQVPDRQLARGLRVLPLRDEGARPHLDVEGDLLVDFLFERHPPQPRTEQASHRASRILDTPVENWRHLADSAARCARPAGVSR